MKVALVGATGNIGRRIQSELVARGHEVTAIARNLDKAVHGPGVSVRRVNGMDIDAMAAALKGHDAVVTSAPFAPGLTPALIAAVKKSGVRRYIMVGGAGSLEVAPGKMLKDTLQLPPPIKAMLDEAAASLERLRGEPELEWTFFSPAAEIGPGERTGKFRLGGDQLVTDANGKSKISYDDYAIALVDELEKPSHIRKRFTIAY